MNFETILKRIASVEEGGGGHAPGLGLTPYVRMAELKDLENHMIDRLRLQVRVPLHFLNPRGCQVLKYMCLAPCGLMVVVVV